MVRVYNRFSNYIGFELIHNNCILMHILNPLTSFSISRRKAAQMSGVRKGVQPELQPDHPLSQTHRLQAIRLRTLPQGVPAQGRSTTPQRNPTLGHGTVNPLIRRQPRRPEWRPRSGHIRSFLPLVTTKSKLK